MSAASLATSPSPTASIDRAIERAAAELVFYVERDRKNLGDRRRMSERFRSDRLMLGHQLNEQRRGLTDHAFGRVLRRLGMNRHTAHHAMRLASEFSRPDGSLDLDLLRAARERNACMLRMTRQGQRALEASPESLSIEDLTRIMGRRSERNPLKCVDAHQHTCEGNGRAMGNGHGAMGGEGGAALPDALPHCPLPTAHCPSPPDARGALRGPGGGGGGLEPPAAAAPGLRGAAGIQMTIDFESAADRAFARMERVRRQIALGRMAGVDFTEGLELLERLDAWTLSLLHQGGG